MHSSAMDGFVVALGVTAGDAAAGGLTSTCAQLSSRARTRRRGSLGGPTVNTKDEVASERPVPASSLDSRYSQCLDVFC